VNGTATPPRRPGAPRRFLPAPAPAGPLLPGLRSRWAKGVALALWLGATYVLTASGYLFLRDNYLIADGLALALCLVQTLPMAAAPVRPLPAWAVSLAASVAPALHARPHGHEEQPWPWAPANMIAYLFLLVPLALRSRRLTLIAVWAATAAGTFLAVGVGGATPSTGNVGLVLVLTAGVLAGGDSVRTRREAQARAARAERAGREERARRALLEERARIARELHDVVAHHMSVITVQAQSGPYRVDGLPRAARAEFEAIADAARESLAEMRRLLGVLRDEGQSADRAPQPDLDRLPRLVETARRAGVRVRLDVREEVAGLGELPSGVGLSAYRIVQEALSNVVRHAPGAEVRVELAADPGGAALLVTVVNAAAPAPRPPRVETGSTGQGLAGMRERVALLGGSLETGMVDGGGFRVAARLPTTLPA
jgi:signal transduction histidine kinase